MFITLYASITWFRLNGYILSTHQLVRHPGESSPSLFAGAKLVQNVRNTKEITKKSHADCCCFVITTLFYVCR